MINHNFAIEILKNVIKDLKEFISEANNAANKTSLEYIIKEKKRELDNLEGSLTTFITFTNKPLKVKNNTLRLKATKNNEEIKINVIEKDGKKYAIVPLEILPKYIKY